MNRQQKLILCSGILIYSLLGLLAALYYRERTVFADVAMLLFAILKDGHLAIQVNRFGAVLTQVFPLVCGKLHVPLMQTMVIYSEGFVLYNLVIFLLCFFITREKSFAATCMLFSVFMTTESFYWIQSELLQAIAFTVLFFALLTRKNYLKDREVVPIFLLILMLITAIYFHPLLIIVFVFFSLFLLLDFRFVPTRKMIWSALITAAVIMIIKNYFLPVPGYDANASESIRNFRGLFPHYFNLRSNTDFLNDLLRKFYLLIPSLLLMTVYYFRNRRYKKLLLCWSFVLGYLALVNITHTQGDSFYMESLYLPLSVFVIVPLMFDVFPAFSFPVQFGIMNVIIITRIISIQQAHIPYSQRIVWEENFLKKTESLPQKKLLIDEKEVPLDTLKMAWGSPYEFWLLSTIKKNETRSVVITDHPEAFGWALADNKSFITKWGVFKYDQLPERYFTMHDTSYYVIYHP